MCEYSRSRSFHDDLILQDQASGERSQDQWSSGSECTSYGSGFQEIPNYFIDLHNFEIIENVTMGECLEFCRNRTEFTCRTLEYGWVSNRCSLQNVTSLHVPGAWFEDEQREYNISHFIRDCF